MGDIGSEMQILVPICGLTNDTQIRANQFRLLVKSNQTVVSEPWGLRIKADSIIFNPQNQMRARHYFQGQSESSRFCMPIDVS